MLSHGLVLEKRITQPENKILLVNVLPLFKMAMSLLVPVTQKKTPSAELLAILAITPWPMEKL